MKRKLRSAEAGMTLIEIMFAAGIGGTALAMMFSSLMTISLVGEIAVDRALVITQLDSVIEEMRDMTEEEILAWQPPRLEDGPGTVNMVFALAYGDDGTAFWLPKNIHAQTEAEASVLTVNLPNPTEIRVIYVWLDDKGRFYWIDTSTRIGF